MSVESSKPSFVGFETLQPDCTTAPNQGVVRGHGALELDDEGVDLIVGRRGEAERRAEGIARRVAEASR